MSRYEKFAKRVIGQLQEKFPTFTFKAMKTKKMISIWDTCNSLISKHSLEKQFEWYLAGKISVKEIAEDIGMIYQLEKVHQQADLNDKKKV